MKKKIISLLLVATMAVSMVACGSAASDGAANGGQAAANTDAAAADTTASGEKILSVQIGPDPETIDPALNSAVDGGNMLLYTHECLLVIGEDGSLQPGQAESYEVSEDGLTWTFHLRDGLKWSDGTDLTANDFVYSWKRVCDPMVAAPYADTVLSMVAGYEDAIAGNLDA
ncbi:MAG: peptide ABC transporter substrate-binding protein, partial [Pseudobutyrivibrio sp.]|nr:peptide ABC transporter substrate-binding protein [Pseudobutyrivibrio sp.]